MRSRSTLSFSTSQRPTSGRIPFANRRDDTCNISQLLFVSAVIPVTHRIGKKFAVILQTVMVSVEQVFYVPAYDAKRDFFLEGRILPVMKILCYTMRRDKKADAQ